MTKNIKELEITSLNKILGLQLEIPTYQRPYRWSARSCNILFSDLLDAFENNVEEYRIGTVILHKDSAKNIYNIIDGQQRLTTLSILLYCLEETNSNSTLLNQNYNKLSDNSIVINYEVLAQNVNELSDEVKNKFVTFLKNKCKLIKIVTDDEQEAFQFFDSQNSRGKALAPHDLL